MLDKARLEVLLSRYFNQILTPGERNQLEARLESSVEARAMFWEHARIHHLMREWALERNGEKLSRISSLPPDTAFDEESQWIGKPGQDEPTMVGSHTSGKMIAIVAGLAACLVLIFIDNRLFHPSRPDNAFMAKETAPTPAESDSRAVAVVTGVDNVDHERPRPFEVGKSLEPGPIRLQRGFLQIDFHSGARLLLEGPAELNLVSSREVTCLSGRLSADVPPQARGFRINTRGMYVVDLGTSFGLNVNPQQMEVHVFEGEVELHGETGKVRSLYAGQAEIHNEGIPVKSIASMPGEFSRSKDLQNRFDANIRQRHQQWLRAGEILNQDPSLRLRFDFEGQNPQDCILQNKAAGDARAGAGNIIGGSWAEGRWRGKSALAFSSVNDRIRVSVPGKMDSVTFAAWVKINSTEHIYNSLCMSDDFSSGTLHWQIRTNLQPLLGTCKPDGENVNFDSPKPILRELLGKWLHLAVVYDNQSKQVRHFLNGSLQSEELLSFSQPVELGIAEIGNWNPRTYYTVNPNAGKDGQPIRNFSGSVDEFEIFSRALSNSEIESLYQQGAP